MKENPIRRFYPAREAEKSAKANNRATKRHKSLGQSLVEFALVTPLLLLVIFGIIDIARIIQAQVTVDNAARQAMRFAITGQTLKDDGGNYIPRLTSITDQAIAGLAGLPLTDTDDPEAWGFHRVRVTSGPDNQEGDPGSPNDVVVIKVFYTVKPLTPLVSAIIPGLELQGTEMGINEEWGAVQSFDHGNLGPTPLPLATWTPVPYRTQTAVAQTATAAALLTAWAQLTSIAQTQTAAPLVTQTAIARATMTADARATRTSVAQTSTAIAGATNTAATQTAVVVNTQTAIAAGTQTAIAGATQTTVAAITQTAVAIPTQTARVIATQTGIVIATQTSVAAGTQTAIAIPTQTARTIATQTAGVKATQTSIAAGTQTAVAGATQTAVAVGTQTAVSKTQTAGIKATQTSVAAGTQTAVTMATRTAGAIATLTAQAPTPTSTATPIPLKISIIAYKRTGYNEPLDIQVRVTTLSGLAVNGATVTVAASNGWQSWSGTLGGTGSGYYTICNAGSFSFSGSYITINATASKTGYKSVSGSVSGRDGNLTGCP